LEIHIVTPSGKTRTTLEVLPEETIDSIQERVQSEQGRTVWWRPTGSAAENAQGARFKMAGDTLQMGPMTTIRVHHYNGMKFTLENVDPTQTLSDTKDQIERLKNIPRHQQRISFQGKPLTRDPKSLNENQNLVIYNGIMSIVVCRLQSYIYHDFYLFVAFAGLVPFVNTAPGIS
jgi:hypothetical protein